MNYKDMTNEEIEYQLEWSDENEFGTNYAKFLREENKQLKQRIDKAIEYINDEMYAEPKELYGLVPADELLKILGDKENE